MHSSLSPTAHPGSLVFTPWVHKCLNHIVIGCRGAIVDLGLLKLP